METLASTVAGLLRTLGKIAAGIGIVVALLMAIVVNDGRKINAEDAIKSKAEANWEWNHYIQAIA
ncbi:MAG TPA: hypothetical protein VLA42_18265 [Verrucomicrobiae bacterium]|nr:hypothetical protein [Verrucomicrobiae bacterium]